MSCMIKGRVRSVCIVMFLLGGCGGGKPEMNVPAAQPAGPSSADIGGHVVHFNAQTTDQLPLTVARALDITRSKNRAMLSVTVLRESDDEPVPAEISVRAFNLLGQPKNLALQRIDETGAIYYLGLTSVANRETLVFDISVRPEGAERTSEIRFQREFFAN